MDLAVLESADVEGAMGIGKDPLPVIERLVDGHDRPTAELLCALGKWRNQNRNVFCRLAVTADMVEQLNDVGIVSRRFVAEVPAFERWVVTIALDSFIDKGFVEIYFLPPTSAVPEETGIVGAKEDVQVELVSQAEKQFANVVVNREKIGDRLRGENALVLVSGSDDDNGVDTDCFIEFEFFAPLRRTPVLGRDVVGDFVEKGSGDSRRRGHKSESTSRRDSLAGPK